MDGTVGNTLTDPLSNIRYVLGLTGDMATLISDEEIILAIEEYPHEWRFAAAMIATHLAAKALNDPSSFSLSGVMSISWPDQAAAWRSIAYNLRLEANQLEKKRFVPTGIQQTQLQREQQRDEDVEYRRKRPRSRFSW